MTGHKHTGLIALREDYNLSQSGLAEKLGTTKVYISQVENMYIRGNLKFWGAVKLYFEISDDDIWKLKDNTLDVTKYISE